MIDNSHSSDTSPLGAGLFIENFARELFEFHTMGAENYFGVIPRDQVSTYADGTPRGYVDADVYDAAECFTGWTVNSSDDFGVYGDFLYRNDNHSQVENAFSSK